MIYLSAFIGAFIGVLFTGALMAYVNSEINYRDGIIEEVEVFRSHLRDIKREKRLLPGAKA